MSPLCSVVGIQTPDPVEARLKRADLCELCSGQCICRLLKFALHLHFSGAISWLSVTLQVIGKVRKCVKSQYTQMLIWRRSLAFISYTHQNSFYLLQLLSTFVSFAITSTSLGPWWCGPFGNWSNRSSSPRPRCATSITNATCIDSSLKDLSCK